MSGHLLGRFLRAGEAAAVIEFAFVVPIVLLLAAGMTELGRAYHIFNSTNKLAMQYAEAWADCKDVSGSCSLELSNYTNATVIGNIAPSLNASQLSLDMVWVSGNGTSSPTIVYPSSKTSLTTKEASAAVNIPTGTFGVIVSASYPFTPQFFPSNILGFLMPSSYNASYTVAQVVKN